MATFPRTLIIGLGGFGSDVAVRVYQKFMGHAQHEEDRKRVGFLALDTDSGEVEGRRKIMNPEDVILTSSTVDSSVGHFLDQIKDNSTVEQWFPTQAAIRNMSIKDGAGQIRVVSRLAFSHAIFNGKLDRVEKLINDLLNLEVGEGNNINIHIVSSLAGGTGAGSFLQMAYFIREILYKKSITTPTLYGYFLLADVFAKDSRTNLSEPVKKESIYANTYASIKELTSIFELEGDRGFEFEFGHFSKNPPFIDQNNNEPFWSCFLFDYENNQGNNIGGIGNYQNQITEFLYLNAFSPTGEDTRSAAINEFNKLILKGSSSRFATAGVSRIVYPVQNILEYIAAKRLNVNLSEHWQKIDNDFRKLKKEFVRNYNKGAANPSDEPVLSKYFRTNVDNLAQSGTGKEQMVFNLILRSTKITDQESGKIIGDKTDELLDSVEEYLAQLRDNDREIILKSTLDHSLFRGKQSDTANDLHHIDITESQLKSLRQDVDSFIRNTKRLATEELFFKDYEIAGNHVSNAFHRINTYILPTDKAMHPMAVRYFFYELAEKLEGAVADLKERNKLTYNTISAYDAVYDLPETEDEIETASRAYEILAGSDKKLIKKIGKIFGGVSDLEEFKEKYVQNSNRQGADLKEYALEKLKEHVFGDLLMQVNEMIKNLEDFFNILPAVITKLEDRENTLLYQTSSDSSVINILSEKKFRDKLYEEVSDQESIDFPEEISRNIYTTLFSRTYRQVNATEQAGESGMDERLIDELSYKALMKQVEHYNEEFKEGFAGYNAVEAIKRQANLSGENAADFMSAICREAERRATPFGAKYIPSKASTINSWGVNPECIDDLPGSVKSIFDNPDQTDKNARMVVTDYFDRTEIIREESVWILQVPENFPQFASDISDKVYSSNVTGIYFKEYKKRLEKAEKNPNIPNSHLDRRWSNPHIFRDLGVDYETYRQRILRGLVYGLINNTITLLPTMGWGYMGEDNFRRFYDYDEKPIGTDFKKLLLEGIWKQEPLVERLNEEFDIRLNADSGAWDAMKVSGKNVSIKTVDALKRLKHFKFESEDYPSMPISGYNLISVFSMGITGNMEKDSSYLNLLLKIIAETVIEVSGEKSEKTKKQIISIVNDMLADFPRGGVVNRKQVENMLDSQLRKLF